MRVTKEQAAKNRQAVLDAAGRLFRARGFDAVSVADLMNEAGFTHGGFYNHFPSKEALAEEVAAAGIASNALLAGGPEADAPTLRHQVNAYLSPAHRDERERGCILAALAGDAARQCEGVQASFAAGIAGFVETASAQILAVAGTKGKRAEAEARASAMRLVSEMVGALLLSRAVVTADPELSGALLEASRRGCEAVAVAKAPRGER
ncbi:MAG: TetR family transcriptional regulator [Labilithrix sp.]|nr:TetR family transcriptional regulator [Labilithrix sp.]